MEKEKYTIELTSDQVNVILGCIHYGVNVSIDEMTKLKQEEFIEYKDMLINMIETHNHIAKECNKPRVINLTIIGE